MDRKSEILVVTFLLFIYNALFAYVVVNLTSGINRFVFLMLLAFDYIIIFYFILNLAKGIKFQQPGKPKKANTRRK